MRLIQVRVPSESREAVTTALSEADVEHVLTGEARGRDAVIVQVLAPGSGVDPILQLCYDAGLDEDTWTSVSQADAAGSTAQNVGDLGDRFVTGPRGESGISTADGCAPETDRSRSAERAQDRDVVGRDVGGALEHDDLERPGRAGSEVASAVEVAPEVVAVLAVDSGVDLDDDLAGDALDGVRL